VTAKFSKHSHARINSGNTQFSPHPGRRAAAINSITYGGGACGARTARPTVKLPASTRADNTGNSLTEDGGVNQDLRRREVGHSDWSVNIRSTHSLEQTRSEARRPLPEDALPWLAPNKLRAYVGGASESRYANPVLPLLATFPRSRVSGLAGTAGRLFSFCFTRRQGHGSLTCT
jgi:hypothetical protein